MKPFDVDALWALARLGEPSLSPDGSQAVAAVSRYDMEDNRSRSSLWLFSTLGGEPRRLTEAGDKDGQPRWSPDGELIAFTAKREQQGVKDEEPQLYVIAPDGGEARRVGSVPTGVEALRWFPDGKRIAFISWVWPEHKTAAAQAKALKEFKARKETAYVTDEALYRHWDHHIPMGRVPHLHVIDVTTGAVRDLMAGSDRTLDWKEPGADSFCISPDGRFLVFAFDPAAQQRADNCFALAELEVRSGAQRVLLQEPDWHFEAPCYSGGGQHLAFVASHRGHKHTMPAQLAVLDTAGQWAVLSEHWDREVAAPLRWREDDLAIRFLAEDSGRRHLVEFDLNSRTPALLFEGGHAGAFDAQAGAVVVLHDSLQFPPRLSVLTTDAPRRIEALNDRLLAEHAFGAHEEVWLKGALGDPVQMWLIYPPGFSKARKHPAMQVIHGGPHTAFGDSWHWRWNHQVFANAGPGGGLRELPRLVELRPGVQGQPSPATLGRAGTAGCRGRYRLAAASQRWVDRRRITATGGSYGGFMVAWMNGHTGQGVPPGRYQAYVCHAGCFDWEGDVRHRRLHLVPTRARRRLLGRPGEASPRSRRTAFAQHMQHADAGDSRPARLPRARCAGPGLLQHAEGARRAGQAGLVPGREPLDLEAAQQPALVPGVPGLD